MLVLCLVTPVWEGAVVRTVQLGAQKAGHFLYQVALVVVLSLPKQRHTSELWMLHMRLHSASQLEGPLLLLLLLWLSMVVILPVVQLVEPLLEALPALLLQQHPPAQCYAAHLAMERLA